MIYKFSVLAILSFMISFTAHAKEPSAESVERGKEIAVELCSKCHAIGQTGESPLKGAPQFRDFASQWPLESLAESLAEGIVTGHDKMPEFIFSPQQIDDFLGYLQHIGSKPNP